MSYEHGELLLYQSDDGKNVVDVRPTLLIASSDPAQKDFLIRLVINLLVDDKVC